MPTSPPQRKTKNGRRVGPTRGRRKPVDGVTVGRVPAVLRQLGQIATVDGGQINADTDLAVTAGWGSGGNGKPVMPGRGRVIERPSTAEERAALAAWGDPLGIGQSAAFALLGEETRDIFLNERVCWRNVPERVWRYTMGGYQVIKKWLSYREQRVLGCDLTLAEAQEVTEMIRRIAAILLLGPELDASYRAIAADPYPWPRSSGAARQGALVW